MSTELDVLKDIRRILKKILDVMLIPFVTADKKELPLKEE